MELEVVDDDVGFDAGGEMGLPRLVADRRFGLAGMYERAEISGARLEIHSAPGQGTRVQVAWAASSHP